METIDKFLAVALNELGKIKFSGAAVIPAGNAMSALYLAIEELEKLRAESKQEDKTDGEES